MQLKEIAVIRTDFPEKFGIPRQSGLVPGLRGRIEFLPEYRNSDTVRGLEGYSHIWLIWQFSKALRQNWSATVSPPRLGGRERVGVFASRSPFRPNPMGLSSVHLDEIRLDERLGPVLLVSGVDMLDRTPIYDIKPYLPHIDCHTEAFGGFATKVKDWKLSVSFPNELRMKIPKDEWDNVIAILEQDPRTAYIHDESRIWGVSYSHYNIRFTVTGEILTVCEVEDMDGTNRRTGVPLY